jgi:hypothetical protein
MMDLQQRVNLMVELGEYMMNKDEDWQGIKQRAYRENSWFIPEFIELSCKNIATNFLDRSKLEAWIKQYNIPDSQVEPKTVGVVMAGNIPLVGFHDFLSVFLSGHNIVIKPSSKDAILIRHLIQKLYEWEVSVQNCVSIAVTLKNCDAYIATGSTNSSRYFEYYFGKYPNIIRRNRTSVAILEGNESLAELDLLADDIQSYFGLGCRNVTKLFVPENYDFLPLLNSLKKYNHFLDFHKYHHNFDYQLAILIMNSKFFMNSGAVILTENTSMFSPISQIHYEYYNNKEELLLNIRNNEDVQCIVGQSFTDFGTAQQPLLTDYADGVDTMDFLLKL